MPDLATIEDLEDRLGRSLSEAEAAKAPAALRDASGLLRDYTKRDFTENTEETALLRPLGGTLKLPHVPVAEVVQVEQIGTSGTTDRVMSVDEWEFDGIDRITIHQCYTIVGTLGTYADTYRVTYTNGEATVPDTIVSRCCKMVFRAILAPTPVEGLVQERIGQYSYMYGQTPGEASRGIVVELTKDDKRALAEAGYRSRVGTVQLRG